MLEHIMREATQIATMAPATSRAETQTAKPCMLQITAQNTTTSAVPIWVILSTQFLKQTLYRRGIQRVQDAIRRATFFGTIGGAMAGLLAAIIFWLLTSKWNSLRRRRGSHRGQWMCRLLHGANIHGVGAQTRGLLTAGHNLQEFRITSFS